MVLPSEEYFLLCLCLSSGKPLKSLYFTRLSPSPPPVIQEEQYSLKPNKTKEIASDLELDVRNKEQIVSGASNWAHKLRWHGAEEFREAKRRQIRGDRNGFYKTAQQFSFWWVFGSGHWVSQQWIWNSFNVIPV